VSIQAPDSSVSDLIFVLPSTDPIANNVMTVESVVGNTVKTKWAAGSGGTPTMNALFGQTADATVANTVTPTSLLAAGQGTASIPASIAVGDSIRVMIRGKMSQATFPNGQFQAQVAGATVLDSGAFSLALVGATDAPFEIDMILTCRSLAVPTAAVFAGHIVGNFGNDSQAPRVGSAAFIGTIDTTAAMPLDILWTWDAADAGNTITSVVVKIDSETP
jgi:hypothetical protein